MNINRRTLLATALAGGTAALGVPRSTPDESDALRARYAMLDAALAQSVFKRELFPEPVVIESVELLRREGSFLCRVRSRDGAEGISVAHGTMNILYPIFVRCLQPFFVQQDARRLDELMEKALVFSFNFRMGGLAIGIPLATIEFAILMEELCTADAGVALAVRLSDEIRNLVRSNRLTTADELRPAVKERLLKLLEETDTAAPAVTAGPKVTLVVGVNGTGKTTTVAKLAKRRKEAGASVVLAAADTFRAAAVDQLKVWAERVDVPVIHQQEGADPAAIVFDAIAAARSRDADEVLVDTAGRLHTRANLMKELEKVKSVAAREVSGAPHEVLLVLDATTGSNGIEQAQQFGATAGVDGVVLTKLDGTAKGGVVLAIAETLKLPVRWVGVGEGIDDLLPFDREDFVNSLLDLEA